MATSCGFESHHRHHVRRTQFRSVSAVCVRAAKTAHGPGHLLLAFGQFTLSAESFFLSETGVSRGTPVSVITAGSDLDCPSAPRQKKLAAFRFPGCEEPGKLHSAPSFFLSETVVLRETPVSGKTSQIWIVLIQYMKQGQQSISCLSFCHIDRWPCLFYIVVCFIHPGGMLHARQLWP